MAKVEATTFLVCEITTKDANGKVAPHGLFDRILMPRNSKYPSLFIVYNKLMVEQPCTIRSKMTDPLSTEIGGNWRDSRRDSLGENWSNSVDLGSHHDVPQAAMTPSAGVASGNR
jgi:hypothetical protein